MQKVGRASLLGYLFLAATGCGGTTKIETEGTGGTGNGGKTVGSGGTASGSGGTSAGSGGTSKSSGGTTPSSGGRATGGKGNGGTPGTGGSVGAGGSRADACLISSDCEWGEIEREILSADACPCLYGCPGIALSRETVARRKAQYDALCTPGRDGKGQPCGIDDCIVPPPLACIAQKCVSPRP